MIMPERILPKLRFPKLLLLPALLVLALGCRDAAADAAPATAAATAHDARGAHDEHDAHGSHDADDDREHAAVDDDARGAGSIADLGIEWHDQDGGTRTIAAMGGRPLVVAMVYTTCAHTCPLIIADLKQLEGALTAEQRAAMTFVLVSLDPERDTPARLKAFATASRLDPAHWTLLTGTRTDVRMLAAALGVRYRPGGSGEIDHTNALTILDASGAIAYQQRGVGSGSDDARRALLGLLR